MSVSIRVIPCLDVDQGRVVKGVNFENLRDAGDPVELARRYDAEGADEITFLDVSASSGNRETTYDVVRRTAEQVFVPLTVGGGVDHLRAGFTVGIEGIQGQASGQRCFARLPWHGNKDGAVAPGAVGSLPAEHLAHDLGLPVAQDERLSPPFPGDVRQALREKGDGALGSVRIEAVLSQRIGLFPAWHLCLDLVQQSRPASWG